MKKATLLYRDPKEGAEATETAQADAPAADAGENAASGEGEGAE